jgi:hypothetical protein
VGTVLIGLAVAALFVVLDQQSKRLIAPSPDGSFLLKASWIFAGIGWLSMLGILGFACLPFFIDVKDGDQWPLAAMVVLFGCLGGAVLNDSRGSDRGRPVDRSFMTPGKAARYSTASHRAKHSLNCCLSTGLVK